MIAGFSLFSSTRFDRRLPTLLGLSGRPLLVPLLLFMGFARHPPPKHEGFGCSPSSARAWLLFCSVHTCVVEFVLSPFPMRDALLPSLLLYLGFTAS